MWRRRVVVIVITVVVVGGGGRGVGMSPQEVLECVLVWKEKVEARGDRLPMIVL